MGATARFLRAAAAGAATAAAFAADPAADPAVVAQFEEYLQYHGKQYSGDEWHERFANFRDSLEAIKGHAAKNRSHKLHLNELADMSGAEFARLRLGLRKKQPRGGGSLRGRAPRSLGTHRAGSTARLLGASGDWPPLSMDWREHGKVDPVRQQRGCGACWTFATSSVLASAWGIASGKMVNVSEQQLLDCAGEEYSNDGCIGGGLDGTYEYAGVAPLCTAESYPYLATKVECRPRICEVGIPQGAVRGYVDVQMASEAALLDAVAKQPVTVGISVEESGNGLRLYQGGIFSGDCGVEPNHAVAVVGYGTDNGQDYWLIQNSWGPFWGEHGYFRLARGGGRDGLGECAILIMPSYPVVEAPGGATTTDAERQWEETTTPEAEFAETSGAAESTTAAEEERETTSEQQPAAADAAGDFLV